MSELCQQLLFNRHLMVDLISFNDAFHILTICWDLLDQFHSLIDARTWAVDIKAVSPAGEIYYVKDLESQTLSSTMWNQIYCWWWIGWLLLLFIPCQWLEKCHRNCVSRAVQSIGRQKTMSKSNMCDNFLWEMSHVWNWSGVEILRVKTLLIFFNWMTRDPLWRNGAAG